ncbi:MAG: GNAT family N-acetyltransferase [Candidatus Thorarchaeota archaeon]
MSALCSESVFAYAKVDVEDHGAIYLLERLGFNLVDTSIAFEKPLTPEVLLTGRTEVRFASSEDQQGVRDVARQSFRYSRFHLDPHIPKTLADEVKASWAGNYFAGGRGDNMVVAQLNSEIVGFLQLLYMEGDLVIDLIAVDARFRRMGIAGDMINFAQSATKDFHRVVVGTQLANVPSIRLYEGMGFRVAGSKYIFHFHSR